MMKRIYHHHYYCYCYHYHHHHHHYYYCIMQGDGGSPSGIALMAGAGIPSDAGSPQQGIHPGATLRHPPTQGASLQMTPQVSLLPHF